MKIRKILITGAARGISPVLFIERLRSKYELILTDLIEPKPDFKDLPFVQADLTNYEEIEKACEGHDAVVHLVALVRERFDKPAWLFADVMVKGTWNVAEACAVGGVKRLVNISSISACSPLPDGELPYRVGAPFGFSSGGTVLRPRKILGRTGWRGLLSSARVERYSPASRCHRRRWAEPRSQGARQSNRTVVRVC